MSVRSRLVVAFVCLSVVPLSAMTAFWHASSVNAFERAAEREATQTAAEIGRRMELITSAAEHAHGIVTVLERVEQSVRAFRGTAEPFDDATVMALRVEE